MRPSGVQSPKKCQFSKQKKFMLKMSEKHAPLITIKNSNKKILKRAAESSGHKKKPNSMLDGCSKIDSPSLFLLLELTEEVQKNSFGKD